MKLAASITLFSLLIFFSEISFGQSLIKNFQEDFIMADSDPLGNFYLVNNDRIIKTDSTGTELFSYADPESGSISYIDASDPFRTLLYYREYNQLSILDRTLSPLGEPIALDEIEIFKPVGIAKSSLGGFWLLDSSTSALVFIDHKLTPVMSVKITGLDFGDTDPWFPLFEWKKRLYLCITGKQVRQFDLFGTQLKSISSAARDFTIYNGKILLVGPGEAETTENAPGFIPLKVELGISGWDALHISGNHALVKQESGWSLFRLKKTL